ncbi:GTP pyrophosphokinase, partial [Erwinia amylovora]|nr:GTP pyrophosphokinase [Erwinia amylovora]
QASPAAQTIKLADIIDNTRSINHYDPQCARVYLVEKRVQIALLKAGNAALLQQAKQIAEQSIRQLGQPPHTVPASWFERQEAKYRQAINAAAGNASYS